MLFVKGSCKRKPRTTLPVPSFGKSSPRLLIDNKTKSLCKYFRGTVWSSVCERCVQNMHTVSTGLESIGGRQQHEYI